MSDQGDKVFLRASSSMEDWDFSEQSFDEPVCLWWEVFELRQLHGNKLIIPICYFSVIAAYYLSHLKTRPKAKKGQWVQAVRWQEPLALENAHCWGWWSSSGGSGYPHIVNLGLLF